MTVCIDTNTLVQARATGHPYFPILNAAILGRLRWAISNRILSEYEEIITLTSGHREWHRILRLIELADAISGSVVWVAPHYQIPGHRNRSGRQRLHGLGHRRPRGLCHLRRSSLCAAC